MNIFEDITHRHHHDQEQHTGMQQNLTFASQPQATVADHLHAIAGVLDSNPFASRLLATGAGRYLTASDADHVIAIIAAIEQNRYGQQLPDITSQPAAGPTFTAAPDSAQFPPAQQQAQ